MKFKVNNKTGSPIKYENDIQNLCSFGKDRLGFKKHPTIFLNHDQRNAEQIYGKTGYYDPETMEIHVFATGRHPKDILRSIAHELVHHSQNEKGELDTGGYVGPGYAQKNPALRKAETEANDPMFFRDYEDWTKANKSTNYNQRRKVKMSLKEWKNKEIGDLLTEKWGFKMDLRKLNEEDEKEKDDEEEEKEENDKEEDEKEKVEEGEIPDQLKPHVKKKQDEKGDDDSEDKKDDSDEKEDKPKAKSGKMPMKKDTKDADNDGSTDDEVPEFLDEEKLVNEVMRRIRNLIMKGKK